jgi:dephospho-CoA kinase
MNIWLLAGYAGSGKTSSAELFQKYLPYSKTTAFAKRVKDDVAALYELDRESLETQEGKAACVGGKTVRDILIEYSAKHKLETNPAIWAEYVKQEILESSTIQNWIIHDWRYTAEYQTMLSILSATVITVRVVKSSVKVLDTPSEHELDNTVTDYIIHNNGSFQDLDLQVETIIYRDHK